MNDAATPGVLRGAGMGVVRYPGGSHSDVYHWKTGTASGGAYVAPQHPLPRLLRHPDDQQAGSAR
ncbi:hypothetical protein [Streptomyces sp. CB01881]|uniref:hypothetical protein n=1 Tax=Streptomyces sp. CB01881 TaxID=2078691 RepID=UPI0018842BCA|nr:hypothetical protein [Streptomyces sp. CB01881]